MEFVTYVITDNNPVMQIIRGLAVTLFGISLYFGLSAYKLRKENKK